MAKGRGPGGSYRSATSGRFVTAAHGRRSPSTTVRETRGGGSTGGTYRSAVSGRFVAAKHGKANPNITIRDS